MSFQFNRSSKEPMSEINVTPFVDVMLVLLIIFMITAPLLTVGVQVDLPESAADSLPDDQEPLTLSINSKGEVFIQEHQVVFNKIVPKILAILPAKIESSPRPGPTDLSSIILNGAGSAPALNRTAKSAAS